MNNVIPVAFCFQQCRSIFSYLRICFLLALATGFASTATANPLGFAFYQGGFQDGAYLSGYAIGNDLNSDGILFYSTPILELGVSPGVQEIQGMSVFFSGNSVVSAFMLDETAFNQPPFELSGFDEGIHFGIGRNVAGEDVIGAIGYAYATFLTFSCAGLPCLDFQFTGFGVFLEPPNSSHVYGGLCRSQYDCLTADPRGLTRSFGAFVISQFTPVPEPETYALMLGGLGVLVFVTRRKKKLQERAAA